MSSWSKYFAVLMTTVAFQTYCQTSFAQDEESAPQEAPFVQEDTEFEDFLEVEPPGESSTVEAEVQGAETLEEKTPEEKTVDLNEQVPEAGGVVEAAPEAEPELEAEIAEPAVISAEEPAPRKVPGRSSKGGVEYIQHPQAANGLLAITREGAYIYKTKESRDFHQTGSLRFATMDSPKITAADGTTYEMMYSGTQQPVVMFDYEWQPLTGYGKLGVQAGLGLLYASGQGRFVSSDPVLNGQEAKEKYTFLAVPLSLGGVYRLEWLSRQWVAPYVAGGGTYIAVAEFRDDGKSPSAVGTPGAYGAAGLLLNISAVDRETAFVLSSEYGIANLWVSLEYRYLQTFNEDLDFSSNIIGAGISVDY